MKDDKITMSEKKSLIIYIIATMAVINLSNCRSFHASSRLPSAPYLLVDTIVLHDPKVIEPSKVLHDIWFLSQDTTIAQKKYSEWKLLHMDNVYI